MVNKYTRNFKNCAYPCMYSPQLKAEAQKEAEYMARTGIMRFSAYSTGNLARFPCDSGIKTMYPIEPTIPGAVFWWTFELPFHCRNLAVNESIIVVDSIASFSRMVWKGSEKVGYGAAVSADGYIYVVAKYSPPASKDPDATLKNVQCVP